MTTPPENDDSPLFHPTPAQWASLCREAERTGTSPEAVLEMAVREYLQPGRQIPGKDGQFTHIRVE